MYPGVSPIPEVGPSSAPLMSSGEPSRTVMRGSAFNTSSVWLKHFSAVGSRMKFMTNWYKTKMRACSHREGEGLVRNGLRLLS